MRLGMTGLGTPVWRLMENLRPPNMLGKMRVTSVYETLQGDRVAIMSPVSSAADVDATGDAGVLRKNNARGRSNSFTDIGRGGWGSVKNRS